ncbi:hypothetical protein ACWD4T_47365, partial [Streptomyces umbrinus]
VEASSGEPERAARLLGAGTRLWHAAGLPQLGDPGTTVFRREYARHLRKALGEEVFAEAVREGRELSPEAAVLLALDGVLDEPDL